MEKINLVELLKDCPKGMELDCTMIEGLEFDGIVDAYFPIRCRRKHPDGGYNVYNFTENGCWTTDDFAKCVIFPKGKNTWKGFQKPFKNGDIIYIKCEYFDWYSIFNKCENSKLYTYVDICISNNNFYCSIPNIVCECSDITEQRFVTKEEKEKLFKAIKDNGYKWNTETKTLEKLIEPKFKVGDKIKHKDDKTVITITGIKDNYYFIQFYNIRKNDYQNEKVLFEDQNKYELVLTKFDINTLVPFESKVLCRDNNTEKWKSNFWGFYDNDHAMNYPFECCGTSYGQCIPFEGNEHLLGNTNDCDEYYKTWN